MESTSHIDFAVGCDSLLLTRMWAYKVVVQLN